MKSVSAAAGLVARFGVRAARTAFVQRGVYRIVLPNRESYCLKRMPCSESRLRWIDKTLLAVKKNGFTKVAWRDPLKRQGKRLFVKTNSRSCFILSPWLQGRWPAVHSRKDMQACGAALAQFHRACHMGPYKAGAFNMIGKWPGVLASQHALLKKLVFTARRNGYHRAMDRYLQQHGSEILGYSEEARRLLQQSNYKAVCQAHRSKAQLCHGDGGPTNFLINAKGVHLIDFETLRLDLRAYDLYRVIYNSCKDHKWNFTIARSFLDGYQSVSKLTRKDFSFLKVWLRFPQTVYLLLRTFNHKSVRDKSAAERGFLRALQDERRILLFLKQLEAYRKQCGAN
ncbi:phosphotransferase [Paenibacillus allorhizosphaerae]|uniref:Homoserine kinase n=1 Tax=Paenibacillus allorhizosphaerae TaxID=2849866 RepID=A0ABN7TGH2_9BACL|nr:Homoserine kinase [Paenibacillus allorhizosphaerae]